MHDSPLRDSAVVYRRVRCEHYNQEKHSIFGKAFANDREQSDRHSVSLESMTSPEELLELSGEPDRFIVVSLTVGDYRQMGQVVEWSPTDHDPGHCDVIGPKPARVKDYLRRRANVLPL